MRDLDSTLEAIAISESGGNPWYQQDVMIRGTRDRKLGAYGILQSRWGQLAGEFGYGGARWDDYAAQRTVASNVLERAYQELGSWELAAVAFRYGMPLARHLRDTETYEPANVESKGYTQAADYLRSLRSSAPAPSTIEGRPPGGQPKRQASPQRVRAEDIVRQRLVEMRNMQRTALASANTQEDEGVSDELGMAGQ